MEYNFENTQSIGDVIKEFVKQHRLAPKLEEASIATDWPKIVGNVTAKYTSEVYLKNNALTVRLKSAALRKELMMSRTQLISNINNYYGKEIVKTIEFR